MYLVYLDESGNSGNNLQDLGQPVFVLCALMVPEAKWLGMEIELQAQIEDFFPAPRPDNFEIHANEIINARGYFRQFPIAHRLKFLASWMHIAEQHELKVIYRAIVKKRYARWLHTTFGTGVIINPHVVAFVLVAQVVNEFLRMEDGAPLGILIADENKEIVHDVEKSIRLFRGDTGDLRLGQIVEKGFFIESDKSLFLQLCDVCAFCARRLEEQKAGIAVKTLDQQIVPWLAPLVHRGREPLPDVLTWLENQQKKGAARD